MKLGYEAGMPGARPEAHRQGGLVVREGLTESTAAEEAWPGGCSPPLGQPVEPSLWQRPDAAGDAVQSSRTLRGRVADVGQRGRPVRRIYKKP
jgi:hypothetical protein